MRGFERVATRGNKKCGLCLYLIHTFGPIACIKSDVRWYKYIYVYTYIYAYVIARVGVKFGINLTSVRLSGNKIALGEAECYLPHNLTRVKFVPNFTTNRAIKD